VISAEFSNTIILPWIPTSLLEGRVSKVGNYGKVVEEPGLYGLVVELGGLVEDVIEVIHLLCVIDI
jgi:hypothetical protein